MVVEWTVGPADEPTLETLVVAVHTNLRRPAVRTAGKDEGGSLPATSVHDSGSGHNGFVTDDTENNTTTPIQADGLDPDAVKMFGLKVWTYRMGEVVSMMIHLGDRLGLYAALQEAGPVGSAQLATATGLDQRFLHEWLMGQASAGLIDLHDDGRFELNPVQAALLADEEGSVDFAAGSFQGGYPPALLDRIIESFRTGVGLTYEEQGPEAAAGLARMTAPRSRHSLSTSVVPGIEGLLEMLESGVKVVEIGCGAGVALSVLARSFPASRFVGIDPSPSAIALAAESARSDGIDNVEFIEGFAADVEPSGNVGLIMAFDCLHDMPHPQEAAGAAWRALADDGVFLVKEIRSTGDFSRDRRNPLLPMLYGFSISSCLQSALSEPGGMGLGTLGLHPDRISALMTDAGFSSCRMHDFGDPSNLYYEIRK